MTQEREIVWPKPTIDQAINASMMIANYYCSPTSEIDVGEESIESNELTDDEAEQRLLELADNIMEGEIDSHIQVARTVRSLGYKIGALGSVSTEIDYAAYKVAYAVYQKQGTFQENKQKPQ